MKLDDIIKELRKYDRSNFVSYEGSNLEQIEELEKRLKFDLPTDFRNFLLISNGAVVNCHNIFGIVPDKPFNDLYGNYIFEKDEVENPIHDYLLPIYPDGMGNHNCLDLNTISADGETCNVIFWQHDWFYKPNEQPDIDANSFTEFLENLLKEISKRYNYDGSDK